MKRTKKIIFSVIAILTAFTLTSCTYNDLPTTPSGSIAPPIYASSNSDSDLSDDTASSDGALGSDDTAADDDNTGSDDTGSSDSADDNGGGSDGDQTDQDDPIDEEMSSIVDEAYLLSNGESMNGKQELTGKITSIDVKYTASNGICLYMTVKGRESKPIYCYRLTGEGADELAVGDTITVYGTLKNYKGLIEFDKNCTLLDYTTNGRPSPSDDPYSDVDEFEFYLNYTVATSYADAYFRTQHGLMSGSLTVPDQEPQIPASQPKQNGKLIRNSRMRYEDDGNTYVVTDVNGKESFRVYRGGAYVTLEEVAAYVYAFGTCPENYDSNKNAKPGSSVWGEYLRVNHTPFSGDTSRYPYEPILPNISGCGGTLYYYEMDIGTTGTDCDPDFPCTLYNNGKTITRGAARIVYGKQDLNENGVYEEGEFYLFYTYNHYNDFQEYLNYEGGWGEMFGNITGGGSISSTYDYNPTDYIESVLSPLPTAARAQNFELFLPRSKFFF